MDSRTKRSRRARAGVLVLALALVAGCGSEGAEDADPTPTTAPTASTAAGGDGTSSSEAPSTELTDVVLVSGEAEDGTVLRLHPEVGDTQRIDMTMTMEQSVSQAGQELDSTIVLDLGQELAVDEVGDDGITYTSTIATYELASATGLPASATEDLEELSAAFEGLEGTVQVDDRGRVIEADIPLPSGMPAEAQSLLEQIQKSLKAGGAPLPEEPVEVGAVWRVETPAVIFGVDLGQVVTYELVALDGDEFTLEATYEEATDRPGAIDDLPGMPQGGSASFEEYSVSGAITIGGSLSQVLPASTSGALDTSVLLRFSEPGGPQQELRQDIRVSTEANGS